VERLPPAERQEFRALWQQVAVVPKPAGDHRFAHPETCYIDSQASWSQQENKHRIVQGTPPEVRNDL
jgi:hypothetical protein